jgi:hypothetical protein
LHESKSIRRKPELPKGKNPLSTGIFPQKPEDFPMDHMHHHSTFTATVTKDRQHFMGLSLHYSGAIADTARIPELTQDLKGICQTFDWEFHVIDSEDFQGIVFSPPECEIIFFTFHNSAELASFVLWEISGEVLNTISVKTQYAGIDAHMAIVRLLKYISGKYMASFECYDEGYYWETNDEEKLQEQFDRYNAILSMVANALGAMPAVPGETPEALADRMEDLLKRLGGTVVVYPSSPRTFGAEPNNLTTQQPNNPK